MDILHMLHQTYRYRWTYYLCYIIRIVTDGHITDVTSLLSLQMGILLMFNHSYRYKWPYYLCYIIRIVTDEQTYYLCYITRIARWSCYLCYLTLIVTDGPTTDVTSLLLLQMDICLMLHHFYRYRWTYDVCHIILIVTDKHIIYVNHSYRYRWTFYWCCITTLSFLRRQSSSHSSSDLTQVSLASRLESSSSSG